MTLMATLWMVTIPDYLFRIHPSQISIPNGIRNIFIGFWYLLEIFIGFRAMIPKFNAWTVKPINK